MPGKKKTPKKDTPSRSPRNPPVKQLDDKDDEIGDSPLPPKRVKAMKKKAEDKKGSTVETDTETKKTYTVKRKSTDTDDGKSDIPTKALKSESPVHEVSGRPQLGRRIKTEISSPQSDESIKTTPHGRVLQTSVSQQVTSSKPKGKSPEGPPSTSKTLAGKPGKVPQTSVSQPVTSRKTKDNSPPPSSEKLPGRSGRYGKISVTPSQPSGSLDMPSSTTRHGRGKISGTPSQLSGSLDTSSSTTRHGQGAQAEIQVHSSPRGRDEGNEEFRRNLSNFLKPKWRTLTEWMKQTICRKVSNFLKPKWRTLSKCMKRTTGKLTKNQIWIIGAVCVMVLMVFVILVMRRGPAESRPLDSNGSEIYITASSSGPEISNSRNRETKDQNDPEMSLGDKLNKSWEDIKEFIERMISGEMNKGQKKLEEILKEIGTTQAKVAENFEKIEILMEKVNTAEKKLSTELDKVMAKVTEVQEEMKKMINDIMNDIKSIEERTAKKIEEEVEKIRSLINEKVDDLRNPIDEKYLIQVPPLREGINRTEDGNQIPLQKDTWRKYISFELVLCILSLFQGLTFIFVLCLCYKFVKLTGALQQTPTVPKVFRKEPPKTDHVGNLEDSICIVSFDEVSSRTNHLSMTRQIADSGELTVKLQTKRVVIKKDSLANLKDSVPPSKVFLVYVDYNEGNMILEKPEKSEISAKRRQTVKYLLDTGALVFIIYCLEKSSENLTDELYAQKLTTIKQDPVLKDLSKKDRIISIYKEFNKKQIEVIIEAINAFAKQSV